MAAPSFNLVTAGQTDAGGAWSLGAWGANAGPATGEVVIFQVLQDGATSGTVTLDTVTGFTSLAGVTSAMTYIGAFPVGASSEAIQHLWIGRRTDFTTATNFAGSNGTSEDLYVRTYSFQNVSTGTTLATVIENATAGSTINEVGTSATAADASVQTLGPDRLALNFVAVNDDNAISEFTGETGGDWTLATTPYAESSGTDGAIALQQARVNPALSQLEYDDFWSSIGAVGSGGVATRAAQSFRLSEAKTLSGVRLWLRASGGPTDDLIIELQSDSSGVPSETVLTTLATIPGASLAADPGRVHLVGGTYECAANTTYWVVLRRSGAASDTQNYGIKYRWADVYADGTRAINNGTGWSAAFDHYFEIYTAQDAAGTINGGTGSIVDSDAWGVVGFALIGTTVEEGPVYLSHMQAPFMSRQAAIRASRW